MNKKALYIVIVLAVVALAWYLLSAQKQVAPVVDEQPKVNNTVTTEVKVVDPSEK